MTDCEAYGKQVFKPHPWDRARAHSASEKEYYETFATTDRAYDKVNIPANCETGYMRLSTQLILGTRVSPECESP